MKEKAPLVVVCRVATTCFVVCPYGNATSVTVSPTFLLVTTPVSVTCEPNFTTGADVASVDALYKAMEGLQPGATLELTLLRGTEERTVTLTVTT